MHDGRLGEGGFKRVPLTKICREKFQAQPPWVVAGVVNLLRKIDPVLNRLGGGGGAVWPQAVQKGWGSGVRW